MCFSEVSNKNGSESSCVNRFGMFWVYKTALSKPHFVVPNCGTPFKSFFPKIAAKHSALVVTVQVQFLPNPPCDIYTGETCTGFSYLPINLLWSRLEW